MSQSLVGNQPCVTPGVERKTFQAAAIGGFFFSKKTEGMMMHIDHRCNSPEIHSCFPAWQWMCPIGQATCWVLHYLYTCPQPFKKKKTKREKEQKNGIVPNDHRVQHFTCFSIQRFIFYMLISLVTTQFGGLGVYFQLY